MSPQPQDQPADAASPTPVNSEPAAVRPVARRADWALALALAAAAFLLYVPSLFNPFVEYDDPHYVTRNAMVRGGLTVEGVKWAFTTTTFGNWLPVAWLSHELDVQLFGLSPAGHHATSAAVHAANAALVF